MANSNPTPQILITLPDHDFDPTESATPWKVCSERGWKVSFATENGHVAAADPRLLKGPILGPLGAGPKGLAAYKQMAQDPAYQRPDPVRGNRPGAVRWDHFTRRARSRHETVPG